ncbi:MAG: hypothetical protein FWD61_10915 [Phycisphaerales bacterium]|nr:hypothetical protein [Phycisphaerales bacterium]
MAAVITCGMAIGQETPAPPSAPGSAGGPVDSAGNADRASLEKFLKDFDLLPGLGRPPESQDPAADLGPDPLGDVANLMSSVHEDLTLLKTDQPVQQKQKDAVETLDKLIVALTPKGGGDGSGNAPGGQGRRASIIVSGQAKIDDLHGVESRGRPWPQLPPKERERILQSRTEGFPPGYELLLQSYYQRLAQERAVGDKESATTEPGQ